MVIIGGGITGGSIARDAALRGLSVCLLEKEDFASGTSSMTSKMIHGGLRYLMNYEFKLVREAALERKVIIEIAPHLAEATEFLVPLYKWSKEKPFLLRLGLIVYDLLAFPKQIGRHKMLNKKKLVDKMELLDNDELNGGASFYDVKTDDSRLTMTNILSAIASGAKAINYAKALSWEDKGKAGVEVEFFDEIGQEQITVSADALVISGGPWSEHIESLGMDFKGRARIRMTRGSHLLLDRELLTSNACLLVNDDGRPIFIIPRINGKILAGTTDVDYEGHPDDIAPTREDVDYILDACNKIFPTIKFENEDVMSIFTGVRPLVQKTGVSEGKVSRNHVIYHKGNVVTILGGKLTTARIMGKDVVNKVIKKIFKQSPRRFRCMTHKLPMFGGDIDDWDEYYKDNLERLQKEYSISSKIADMLVRWYGSELPFFEIILKEHGTVTLIEGSPWLEAQVIYSCRVECIQKPVDFLRRRTPIMLERGNGLQCLDRVAELMQSELQWDEEKKLQMINETKDYTKRFVQVPLK